MILIDQQCLVSAYIFQIITKLFVTMKKDVSIDENFINPNHFHNPVSQQTFDSLPRIYGSIKHRIYSNKLKFYQMIVKNFKRKDEKIKDDSLKKSGNRVRTEKSESKADSQDKNDHKSALSKEKKSKQLQTKKQRLILDSQSLRGNFTKKGSFSDHQTNHKVKFNTLKLHPVLYNSSKGGKPQTLSELIQDEFFKAITVNTPLLNLYKKKNFKLNEGLTQEIKQESKEQSPYNSPKKRYIPKQLIRNMKLKTDEQQDSVQKQEKIFNKLKSQKNSPKIKPQAKKNPKQTEFSRKLGQHNISKMNKFFAIGQDKKFRLPTKDKYKQFIKSYNPVNPSFNIKGLIQKQHFQIVASDKTVYFGEFADQKMHGFGLLITPEYVFEGTFQNRMMLHGSQLTYDGIYTGNYSNNLREGKGRFQWNNGEVYEGEWKVGRKHGYGIWRSFNGDSYQGQWANGRQQGIGQRKNKNNIYKGYLLNSLKHGKGEQYFQNGDHYQGSYQKGKPNGFGRYAWKDGSFYQGQFVDGYRQGKGELHQKNGSIYKGGFRRDFKHGMGQQIQKTGQKLSGIFKQGEFIGEL